MDTNKFGQRKWVRLWVNEWLDGTTRYEMTGTQRAFWIDLLAMAGRSRMPGVICAGKNGDSIVGYPLVKFQSLAPDMLDVERTLELFQKNGKVKVSITAELPVKMYMIEITNWDRYQSEYERQKPYRTRRKNKGLQERLQRGLHEKTANSYRVEVERDIEREEDIEAEKSRAFGADPAAASNEILQAFKSLQHTPFGTLPFQQCWAEEYAHIGDGGFTDAMERTIQSCGVNKIKIPPLFFRIKRGAEEVETKNQFRPTPL